MRKTIHNQINTDKIIFNDDKTNYKNKKVIRYNHYGKKIKIDLTKEYLKELQIYVKKD